MAECLNPVYLPSRDQVVQCGYCNFCLERKRVVWTFRLLEEQKKSVSAYFITMTYDEASVPWSDECDATVCSKRDVQLFMKSLRKLQAKVCPVPLRYYMVSEYGELLDRPHYHIILFNLHSSILGEMTVRLLGMVTDDEGVLCPDLAVNVWKKGIVHVGHVTNASIHYVTKYVINRFNVVPGREPPFALMSRRPGIGSTYIGDAASWHRDGLINYVVLNGMKLPMPRYYKDKIFTLDEKSVIMRRTMEEMSVAERLELERLRKKGYVNPAAHMVMRKNRNHELIDIRNLNAKKKL